MARLFRIPLAINRSRRKDNIPLFFVIEALRRPGKVIPIAWIGRRSHWSKTVCDQILDVRRQRSARDIDGTRVLSAHQYSIHSRCLLWEQTHIITEVHSCSSIAAHSRTESWPLIHKTLPFDPVQASHCRIQLFAKREHFIPVMR